MKTCYYSIVVQAFVWEDNQPKKIDFTQIGDLDFVEFEQLMNQLMLTVHDADIARRQKEQKKHDPT